MVRKTQGKREETTTMQVQIAPWETNSADRILAAVFLLCALLYAWSTFCAILNFGLHQPMFDQYKEYGKYLTLPLFEALTTLENGHRPVIPALIASAEIKWFCANQYLQLAIGTCCVFLATGAIAWTMWREVNIPGVARAAGVLLSVLGVLWLGNARMLLHPVEQLHAYIVVLAVVLGTLCTYRAARTDSWLWIAGASFAGVIAMFTFGAGIAAFPTFIAVAMLMRLHWTKILVPLATAIACSYLYMFTLPGHESIQSSLTLRPVDSAIAAARWLSSPWANGWLGLAAPPIQPWLAESLQSDIGQGLVTSANSLVAILGTSWSSLTTLIGFAGIALFLAQLVMLFRSCGKLHRSEALASALCIFALTSAALFSVGRLTYLDAHPEQVYADRYLVWPCLFWAGLAWLIVLDASRRRSRVLARTVVLAVAVLPIVLFPTHRGWVGWGASIYQMSQRSAASVRSGVFDGSLFPDDEDASRADVVRTLALLKNHNVAMFADPTWHLVGDYWRGLLKTTDAFAADARIVDVIRDSQADATDARFVGAFSKIGGLPSNAQIAVVDSGNRVVGLAEFSFIRLDSEALRFDLPRKRGFDGYIHGYNASEPYRLVLLESNSKAALLVTALSPK